MSTAAERAATAAAIAEIERIIVENAGLLGEPPDLVVKRMAKGWVRIQLVRAGRSVRGEHRDYLGIERALSAARESNRRAVEVNKKMSAGMSKGNAIDSTPFRADW